MTQQTTETTTFTPGPWYSKRAEVRVDGEYDYAIYDANRQVVAEAFGRTSVSNFPPAEANAHLIASAPSLYAVLRDMEWLGLNDGRGVTHRQCPACSALHERGTGHNPHCGLAAALAKAEGRERT